MNEEEKMAIEFPQLVPLLSLPGTKVVIDGVGPDDRVTCESCAHFVEISALMRLPMDQFEKMRKVNHPAFHWFIDEAKIANDWATARYRQKHCNRPNHFVLPVPHRCQSFKPKAEVQADVNWLDEQSTQTPKRRTQRADQVGDVGARVPPRPAADSDTEWWV